MGIAAADTSARRRGLQQRGGKTYKTGRFPLHTIGGAPLVVVALVLYLPVPEHRVSQRPRRLRDSVHLIPHHVPGADTPLRRGPHPANGGHCCCRHLYKTRAATARGSIYKTGRFPLHAIGRIPLPRALVVVALGLLVINESCFPCDFLSRVLKRR